jgi:hypothetical protein
MLRVAAIRSDQRKCTESVSPSSGVPTDRRRSDCRSELHQPLAFRARCKREPRDRGRVSQGRRNRKGAICGQRRFGHGFWQPAEGRFSRPRRSRNKKRTELASPFVLVLRLTSPLRVMPAIEPSLGRNQLGAIANLGAVPSWVKGVRNGLPANCGLSFLRSRSLRGSLCALERVGPAIRRAGNAFVHHPG